MKSLLLVEINLFPKYEVIVINIKNKYTKMDEVDQRQQVAACSKWNKQENNSLHILVAPQVQLHQPDPRYDQKLLRKQLHHKNKYRNETHLSVDMLEV